jgi:hypothetical protein
VEICGSGRSTIYGRDGDGDGGAGWRSGKVYENGEATGAWKVLCERVQVREDTKDVTASGLSELAVDANVFFVLRPNITTVNGLQARMSCFDQRWSTM